MNTDDNDDEDLMLQEDGDSGGNTNVQSARSGDKRRDPESLFTPGP
jgi:hypothetical protein